MADAVGGSLYGPREGDGFAPALPGVSGRYSSRSSGVIAGSKSTDCPRSVAASSRCTSGPAGSTAAKSALNDESAFNISFLPSLLEPVPVRGGAVCASSSVRSLRARRLMSRRQLLSAASLMPVTFTASGVLNPST